ncbi:LeuA family protein [Longimicrobium terrae]|uniref:2-isopropylmalate synthase n=1 Tax=Longimicrobium terrae TaxID=1639882 RepID=A0A841H050_9BACT|nr:2-isopropylmalate synthase [Longimicrobium terrae]MBB4636957.1 2-isopropylmalate synthase [Longimicrobium terrae]MBB6071435.1 2-isopropylmalate synthase [Longimicrobium terrae]NNC31344.1 2-isopropylmalate synthase [Longimicrobium terrae]
MQETELIYDWNTLDGSFDYSTRRGVQLNDETLRDGLQSPSVTDPAIGDKIRLLHLMADLGIAAADIGLPGAGPRAVRDVEALAREIVESKLAIEPNCAARTVRADVQPIIDVSQRVGIAIEAATFIGSSPIRQYAEDWTLDRMLRATEDSVTFAVQNNLPVMYVTEDTTRANPEVVKALYTTAINCGARRICVCDTVGHATPHGVRQLIRFVKREIVDPSGEDVKIDWHGHRDRGLAVPNCLAAIEEGAHRIHGTALGIGERCGNAEMDLLLVNLKLLGLHDWDLSRLNEYVELASEACRVDLAYNWPVFGPDAFRTGTGVHAAAIIKAEAKGDAWLADRIYSGVPAGWFGLSQVIEISPMSGISNVRHWLASHGYGADEGLCSHVFEAAKTGDHTFSNDEVHALCRQYRPAGAPVAGAV